MDVRGSAGRAVPGEYIVGFKKPMSGAQRMALVQSLSPRSMEPLDLVNGLLVKVEPGRKLIPGGLPAALDDALSFLQPNYTQSLRGATTLAADDPDIGRQYHLHNAGQGGGTPGADVKARQAWPHSTGAGVVVAVADTNIDITHPDLVSNIWTNLGEVAGNKIDDDGNGYVDDVHGWNFGLNSNRPQDGGQSHGTHVAGIIAATLGNGLLGAGVAPNAKIMPLAILTNSATTANAIKAFDYAVKNGANIVSNSWGNNRFEPALDAAVRATTAAGTMVVVASGNENWDTGIHGSYPDNYPGSVSIAASTNKDGKASFSNRGVLTVDIAAPGDSILSTTPGGKFGSMSGTSMAAPVYSAIAALVKSRFPHLTMKQVEERIHRSADREGPAAAWNSLVASGGRANALHALEPIATPSAIEVPSDAQAQRPFVARWASDLTTGQRFEVEASLNAGAMTTVDEGFEDQTPRRAFSSAGDRTWAPGTGIAHTGSGSMQVNGLKAEQQARLELTETITQPTELSFWYRSAKGGELSFFLNRDLQFQPATGEEWRQFTTVLQPGEHRLSWLAAGRSGNTGAFAIDGLRIGAVSDAVWTPLGVTTSPEITWTPSAEAASAAMRVRARSEHSYGDWVQSSAFAVKPA